MEAIVQIGLNSAIAASIYALVALGFNLAYGTTKFFNLAHGAMVTIGGYGVFYLIKKLGFNSWLGIGVGVIVAGILGLLIYRLVFRPLHRRRASNTVLLVASLGVFIVLQSLLAITFSSQFQALSDPPWGDMIFEIGGGAITATQIVSVTIAAFLTAAIALLLKLTRFGKAVRAISDDAEVAEIVGIDTERIISIVFFMSAGIAGLAGIIVGFDIGIEPTMGMPLLFSGIVAAIVGGVGSIWGGVLGALLVALVENVGVWFTAGEWKTAIAYIVLILFLIFRPRGITKK